MRRARARSRTAVLGMSCPDGDILSYMHAMQGNAVCSVMSCHAMQGHAMWMRGMGGHGIREAAFRDNSLIDLIRTAPGLRWLVSVGGLRAGEQEGVTWRDRGFGQGVIL